MRIDMKNYGINPDSKDLSRKIYDVLDNIGNVESAILEFEKGNYYFNEEDSIQEVIYMTNTCGKNEMQIPLKKIGNLIRNKNDITINGNGSTFWFTGRMTEFVIDNCRNIKIENLTVNFTEPTVYEYDVIKANPLYFDIKPNAYCSYKLEKKKIKFSADIGGRSVTQECDIKNAITRRVNSMSYGLDIFRRQLYAKKLKDGNIRVYIPFHSFKAGHRYQTCSIVRDGAGFFINHSKNVVLENLTVRFMHGMGVLAQLSENITIINCNFTPDRERDLTTVAFADLVHCSMCNGRINVINTKFDGSRDDIINVHGNHFKVVSIKGNKVSVKFKHPQTYGFIGFDIGDEIEFVDSKSLIYKETNKIIECTMTDKYTTELILENPVKLGVVGDVIENITKTAELNVDNIVADNIPTRGILVTTRKPVTIRNSVFNKTYMSAILVSDDASSWYESGYVRDILIENNVFNECKDYVINILPEAYDSLKQPVHKNIRVINNIFNMNHAKVAKIKRTDGFLFRDNTINNLKNPIIDIEDSINVDIDILNEKLL